MLDHVGHLVAGAGANYRVIHLREAAIRSGCGPCGDCNVRPVPCAEADDVAAVVDAMCQADAIVYAAPVHAFGMAALMQQFLERAGVGHLRFARPLRDKVALPVVTGRRYHHEFIHLCGYPHRWIYADTATMPKVTTLALERVCG